MTDTVQQLAADLTREAQETGLNWVQELADRATALAGISMEHQSAPPPERAILLDLIAEVRAMGDGWWEGDEAADRAEARLKGTG